MVIERRHLLSMCNHTTILGKSSHCQHFGDQPQPTCKSQEAKGTLSFTSTVYSQNKVSIKVQVPLLKLETALGTKF